MPRRFISINPDMLLSGTLLVLILIAYSVVVYVFVVAIAVLPSTAPRTDYLVPWWLNLIAFALIAATLVPVYRWACVGVRELVYAQHDDPYALIAKVNAQLQTMTNPQRTLPALAETIAHELKLPYVAIETHPTLNEKSAAFGISPVRAEISRLPVSYLDQPMGALLASARSPGQPLSESDLALLRDVARQLGIALRTAQLTADLQTSREQLVVAREEERRRIRNDLHDGLAPTLSSLQLQLGAMRNLIRQDPDRAEASANELREDLRSATAEVRRLVYNLRPPALDDLGLLGAIRSQAQKVSQGDGLSVSVVAPDLPPLPAAVEVAAFRIAHEALLNVERHAEARRCVITLMPHEDDLTLEIRDDGRGLPPDAQAGVGLSSMRERASELGGEFAVSSPAGGGTLVCARLPLKTRAETKGESSDGTTFTN